MSAKILVSGLLNVETTVSVRGFPINYYPIDYPFFGVNSNVAGVGCNIAKALTALGDNVILNSFVGSDFEADRIISDLESHGISTGGVKRELKSTPVSVILFDPDGRRQVYCDLKDIQEHTVNPESMTEALVTADAAVLCNINFNRELIIFLSDEGLPCPADEFIRRLNARYHNSVIVMGLGAKGALLLDSAQNRLVHVAAYAGAKVVNTVGAGDSLFSSFLHYYVKGMSAEDSLRRAVVFAGIKIGFNGAGIGFCGEDEIEAVIGR